MKKAFIGVVVSLFSVSVYAQFGQLLQSVKDQVQNTAQMQVNQGVHTATDRVVQSAQTQTRKMVDSARSSNATATTKADQDSKPQ
ncbi:hypothetical protein [Burkholderia seminalis]|uniref:hypothetical protein n=1 Tax=Burkholderia seminalis TaxID=488731 RepID=UPI0014545EA4|nr:hypothetical protein [Burkholderia seminalis]MCA8435388.1 hypothetical protein [Burkholderia seminalis]VWC33006.1 hypothetical protein BSE24067_06516 [Burkholderia seminalis]